MTDELNFWMTDLEERLASQEGAAAQAEILGSLMETGNEIAQRIRAGLPTEEFDKAQAVHQALAAAHEVISAFPVGGPE